jgi:hypothetical protein
MSRISSWIALTSFVLSSGCFDPDRTSETGTTDGVTDTTDGTTETTGDDDAGDEGVADACSDYCKLVSDHCKDHPQYAGTLDCERTCLAMPVGESGAMSGNSIACRTSHAILAAEDAALHCPHAGPSGGDLCGGACESFCTLAVVLCTDQHEVWPNVEACAGDCVQFPSDPPYDATVLSGDSYACRLAHLTLAALQPEVHCDHIRPDSPTCE